MTGKRDRAHAAGGGDAGKERTPGYDVAVVWKLRSDQTIEPVKIRTGITDHTVTEVPEVLKGELSPGEELVTGSMTATKAAGPGMGAAQRR